MRFYGSCRGIYAFAAAVECKASTEKLHRLIDDEILNCQRVAVLIEADDRLGVHDDCGPMFDAPMVRQKIKGLQDLRAKV